MTLSNRGEAINEQNVRYVIGLSRSGQEEKIGELTQDVICISAKGRPIKPKTIGQKEYVDSISQNTVTIGVGPAGTGKTYLAAVSYTHLLNLCGAHGIAFSDLRWESASTLSFTVRAAERKKLERLLAPLDAALTVERAAGAPFFLRRFRRRYTLLAGLAFMLALFFANSFFIWDFEVSGSETVPAEKILRVLEKQGLRRGSFAYSFRPQDICNRALPELPELAWLTVNVRGCRAYVSVRDRVPKPELADDRTPTNVVAKRDALVTEVRAYDGRAMVRKGGTVTAGQLLISGAVQTEGCLLYTSRCV